MARQQSQSKLLFYPTPENIALIIATWLRTHTTGLIRLADPCAGEGRALRTLRDSLDHLSTIGGTPSVGPKLQTWGVELSYSRAAKAAELLDEVLATTFNNARWGVRSTSLMFNNPPYDWSKNRDGDGRAVRQETEFITEATSKLVEGGVHVVIVPQRILSEKAIARHWCGWYDDTRVFRFPGEQYDDFGQVVVFGVVRKRYSTPTDAALAAFEALAEAELPELVEGHGEYTLPAAPATARFEFVPESAEAIARAVLTANPLGTYEWERETYVRPVGAPIKPLVQLKLGHLAMLMSAGEVGVVTITNPAGERYLIKGTLTKQRVRHAEDILDKNGKLTGFNVTEVEQIVAVIASFNERGDRTLFSGAHEVASFITENASPLADAVLARNLPYYDWKPTPKEWETASQSALGLPPLENRAERGLFDIQKHFAIAVARYLRDPHTSRHALFNWEMGTGKTPSSVAAMELADLWPALCMVPPHMVFKWGYQCAAASNPKDPIQARVITRAARADAGWFQKTVVPILADYEETAITHDERWQVEPLAQYDTGLRRRTTFRAPARPGQVWVELRTCSGKFVQGEAPQRVPQRVPNVRAALMDKLKQRLNTRDNRQLLKVRLTPDGFSMEYLDRDEYTMADFHHDYEFGRLGRKAVAIISFESAKHDAGLKSLDLHPKLYQVYHTLREETLSLRVPSCPGCGKPLGLAADEDGMFYTNQGVTEVYQNGSLTVFQIAGAKYPSVCGHYEWVGQRGPDSQAVKDSNGKPVRVKRYCGDGVLKKGKVVGGTRLYEMGRWRRVGLARLVQRQYRHWFKFYIADEIHEAKSGDTDIGTADGRFLASIRTSLALTGTVFGGAATSLFYLLYRRNPEVRQHFGYKDTKEWVDQFGRWKYQWSEEASNAPVERGKSSGIQRFNMREPSELPGISPAVVRYLLPFTLFAKITDLGYTLPALTDSVRMLKMGKELGDHYRYVSRHLLELALERLKKHRDSSLLSVWFTTTRFRPASSYRPEVVTCKDQRIMDLPELIGERVENVPALDPAFVAYVQAGPHADRRAAPKEWALAEMCWLNQALGRKTLVFVEQTGDRNICEHLLGLLAQLVPGTRSRALYSQQVKPAKREAWLKREADSMDVLLVHPGLVKTGLDLVMFSDIIFYELNISLYTVWQAMRRVWRTGQKRTVRTTFLGYEATAESKLLTLMGEKMKAAMILYGDNAAGALVDSDEDEDLQRLMIRDALEGKTFADAGELNGSSLFGNEHVQIVAVTDSPLGSPSATSPALTTLALERPEPEVPLWVMPAALVQADLFGGLMTVSTTSTRKKRK